LLAAGGVYGLLAHLVVQRSREIGIQMALGASGAQISRRIVGQGLVLAGVGIVVGLVTSVAFGRLLESRLFEVSGTDPWTLVSCALLLIAVAVVASYLPARRASVSTLC
jgi:ABC-type antimicrobial peptide transport system permease subunit